MADIAKAVVEALAAPVAGAMPVIAARIPPGPAAELGRIVAAHPVPARPGAAVPAESPVLGALRAAGPLLAERLLGALELAIVDLDLAGVPDLSSYLGQPPTGRVTFVHAAQESQAMTAAAPALLGRGAEMKRHRVDCGHFALQARQVAVRACAGRRPPCQGFLPRRR